MRAFIAKARTWRSPLATLILGVGLGGALTAGGPMYYDIPVVPFQPNPKGVDPLPPIIVDPPVPEKPTHNTPEPGTLVLGALGAGIAGWVAHRKRTKTP